MKRLTNIVLLFAILLTASCNNDEQCRKDRYVKMQVGTYHVTYNPTTKTRTAAYLTIDSMTVKGIGVDSILYNNVKKKNTITLPLNKLDSVSRFQITFNDVTDTITILHTNYDTYLSLECGCIKTHTLDSVITTTHFLDSASIFIHDVNTSTSAKEHIKLYN
jgi:hypothetical protein